VSELKSAGSGGALGIAVGNRILMQENAIYTVITPEGCSAILWKDQEHVEVAATALKITAADLKELEVIDEIVPEPAGGAHLDHDAAADLLDRQLRPGLESLLHKSASELREQRYQKFRQLGAIAFRGEVPEVGSDRYSEQSEPAPLR